VCAEMDEQWGYVGAKSRQRWLFYAYDRIRRTVVAGTVAKLAMRQPFVLFKGLTFQKLCLPGAFRPGDHHNKMLRPGLCVVHASPQYL
ncbi:IS1 family transposase, partial [Enterobacter roggenkampii]